MPEPVAALEAARHGYAGREVLGGVSLSLGPGEVVGVTGPSGCGKSTLLRVLAGLERPAGGVLRYGSVPAWPGRRVRYPRPGYVMAVFQDPFASLDPRWPVWRTLTEPLTVGPDAPPAARRRELAAEWLDRVGMPGVRPDARPAELSGGQCQRVAVARALAARPALLVADEPTARQDVVTAAQLGRLLRAPAAGGTAVAVVSHDRAWLGTVADRVLRLDPDGLVAIGSR